MTDRAEAAKPEFFELGHTYAREHHAATMRFLVKYIDDSPDGTYRVAFGWRGEDGDVTWSPFDSDDFDGWIDVTTEPAAAQPSVNQAADAAQPTPLRWGLDDVMYGDDDTTTVMLSGPAGEPYWLELDPERAAALQENLAGPDSESTQDTLPEWLYQRFARYRRHAPTWGQLTDNDRTFWDHEAAAVRRAVARNGFKEA